MDPQNWCRARNWGGRSGSLRLSIKKILFPVQRVAKIEASRAAAIFFFFHFIFFFHENIVNFFFFFFFLQK